MRTSFRILLLTTLAWSASSAGDRQIKLEAILRAQDGRVTGGGLLQRMLADPDSTVRAAAAHAFGSVQDTSALPRLADRLNDKSLRVEEEAAFAIGQTAGFLSAESRERLQQDLIGKRLDKMSPAPRERMIEEIGKFGSDSALNALLGKYGSEDNAAQTSALVRSVARFAIRSVTTPGCRRWLLGRLHSRVSGWQTAYALQRTGDQPEIRTSSGEIRKLLTLTDPLVRMNAAALLGKLKDDTASVSPLLTAAEADSDWRVRVNALKALGNHDLRRREDVIKGLQLLFSDTNTSVAVIALSVFGAAGLTSDSSRSVQDAIQGMKWIARNLTSRHQAEWQVQAEAATSLAKLRGRSALTYIALKEGGNSLFTARKLAAVGATGAAAAAGLLMRYLGSGDMSLTTAALEGLRAIGEKNPADTALLREIREAAVEALSTNDMAVATTAASILGDSLYRSRSSVTPLLKTLKGLKVPDDVEAMQEIASTLGKIRDQEAVNPLLRLLKDADRSVALAAATALKSITGKDYSGKVPKHFEPLYTDYDFAFLRALPDTARANIVTTRGTIAIELYKQAAPFTVMSFLKLAKKSFYKYLAFHRVVPNFVIQGGDPRGDGWGGPGYSIRSEFSALSYETGSVGIASAGRDTEGSQFFITQSPQPHLDGRYTLFGKVVSGMEVVNRIQVGDRILDVRAME